MLSNKKDQKVNNGTQDFNLKLTKINAVSSDMSASVTTHHKIDSDTEINNVDRENQFISRNVNRK